MDTRSAVSQAATQESGKLWAAGGWRWGGGMGKRFCKWAEEPISEGAPKGQGSLVTGVMCVTEALAAPWSRVGLD